MTAVTEHGPSGSPESLPQMRRDRGASPLIAGQAMQAVGYGSTAPYAAAGSRSGSPPRVVRQLARIFADADAGLAVTRCGAAEGGLHPWRWGGLQGRVSPPAAEDVGIAGAADVEGGT